MRRYGVLIGQPEKRIDIACNRMMYGAAFLWDFDPLQPLGKAFFHIFLEEAVSTDAAMVSLHRDGPPAYVRQHIRRNELVIRREFALGDPVLREHQLLRMRNHGTSRTTSRAALSSR